MQETADLNTVQDTAERTRPVLLQVLPALESGGAERAAVDVAVAAAQSGWESLVASSGGRMVHELERGGAEHITMPIDSRNPFRILRQRGRLEGLIRARSVDIVHARSRALTLSLEVVARRTGVPFVTTVHTTYPTGNPIKKLYNRRMTRADRVIAVSDYIADHLRTTYGLDEGRLRTVHRGIDFAIFDATAVSAERQIQLANEWRLPDGLSVVLLPAEFAPENGQSVLLEALAKLNRHDMVALMAGADADRGQFREQLEKQVSERGLERVVRLRDRCSDMAAAYMLADVVVCPTTAPAGFSRVPVEAQAMGRPVIASDHGSARETILEGRTGWLVKPGDADSLAAALTTALDMDQAARSAVAADARQHVEGAFSKRQMCHRTLEIYGELLNSR